MANFKSVGNAVLFSFALVTSAISAQALTIVQSASFQTLSEGSLSVSGGPDFVTTFDRFDSSLGTLNSFTFSWSGMVTGTVFTAGQSPFGSLISGSYTLGGPASMGFVDLGPYSTNSGTINANGTYDLSLTVSPPAFAVDVTNLDTQAKEDAYDIVTEGSYGVVWALSVGPNSNINMGSANLTLKGNVSMTYDYTPVPEPGAASLAGIAAMSGGAFFRRRRR